MPSVSAVRVLSDAKSNMLAECFKPKVGEFVWVGLGLENGLAQLLVVGLAAAKYNFG